MCLSRLPMLREIPRRPDAECCLLLLTHCVGLFETISRSEDRFMRRGLLHPPTLPPVSCDVLVNSK